MKQFLNLNGWIRQRLRFPKRSLTGRSFLLAIAAYTYGAPRMGDRTFATTHSQLVPNSYRIANLSDTFTLLPPTSLNQSVYVHMGQPWVFSSQQGDVGTNHFISTYRRAIEQGKEVQG